MRARTWGPVVTFAAVAALGTTAALVHGGATGSPAPQRLPLVYAGPAQVGAPVGAGGGADYVLDTVLSADEPADQRAYHLTKGAADPAQVARLADALHAGAPVRRGDAWQAGLLTVSGRAGQAWSWSSCLPPTPMPPDGSVTGSGCAVSGVAVTPGATPPPDLPAATVRAAARDVLAALGLAPDAARIDTSPYGGTATAVTPGVSGFDTQVSVGADGRLSYAAGWLGTRSPGDSYPVVSAKDAYAELPARAHPDVCQVAPGGKGCLPPEPVHVTGAELGLSVQPTTDGGSMLVPSWLFSTRSSGVIAVVAVAKRYWAPEQPPRPRLTP